MLTLILIFTLMMLPWQQQDSAAAIGTVAVMVSIVTITIIRTIIVTCVVIMIISISCCSISCFRLHYHNSSSSSSSSSSYYYAPTLPESLAGSTTRGSARLGTLHLCACSSGLSWSTVIHMYIYIYI